MDNGGNMEANWRTKSTEVQSWSGWDQSAKNKTAQGIYLAKNKQVKKRARKDKRIYIDNLATNALQAAAKNDCTTAKQLSGKRTNNNKPVKDTQVNFQREQLNRWKEHIAERLNRDLFLAVPLIEEGDDDLQIDLAYR